jgi:hypothetical protein
VPLAEKRRSIFASTRTPRKKLTPLGNLKEGAIVNFACAVGSSFGFVGRFGRCICLLG